jgi:hypothetical protein
MVADYNHVTEHLFDENVYFHKTSQNLQTSESMMLASGNDHTANNKQVAKLYISADVLI